MTLAPQAAVDPWSRLSVFIAATLGLHFSSARHEDLRRSFGHAARELGYEDSVACIEWLLTRPPAAEVVQVLASHLTVGETYFYRERPALDALATDVLPALIRARRASGRHYLRLWCAACCTGEEAYTLAILLHRLLPDLRRWDVTIQATDVNERFLAKAAAGRYGEWSFRNAPDWLQPRYFARDPEGGFTVIPEIRRLVRFDVLNLVEGSDGLARAGLSAMDVVLCRNVLMYFTPSHIASVIGRLWQCLSADGWLLVAAGEAAGPARMARFRPVNYPGAILFQKSVEVKESHVVPFSIEPTTATAAVGERWTTPSQSGTRLDVVALSQRARECANEGRLDEALAWCDQWLEADRLDAVGHYLRAIILLEQGEVVSADASLQRATYLNGNFIMAHFTRGHVAHRHGDHDRARRYYSNAERLLQRLRPEEVVPESEHLTVANLTETLRLLALPEREQ